MILARDGYSEDEYNLLLRTLLLLLLFCSLIVVVLLLLRLASPTDGAALNYTFTSVSHLWALVVKMVCTHIAIRKSHNFIIPRVSALHRYGDPHIRSSAVTRPR